MSSDDPSAHSPSPIIRWQDNAPHYVQDPIACEASLHLVIAYHQKELLIEKNLGITMRTPGHDEKLLRGFLFHEGIIDDPQAIAHISSRCSGDRTELVATLHPHIQPDLSNTARYSFLSASCGLCGKESAPQPSPDHTALPCDITVSPQVLQQLPASLQRHQDTFSQTGGLHAAALFTPSGEFIACYEDIGRHNALDKLTGHFLAHNNIQILQQSILLLSGRVSFEMVQKSQQAQIPIIASIGAPSSLAISTCHHSGITLVGFLREQRFNIYTFSQRVLGHTNKTNSA